MPPVSAPCNRHFRPSLYCATARLCLCNAQAFAAVISIFAPCPPKEICAVLQPGGCIVTASPGREHLQELKARIYKSPRPFEEKGVIAEADMQQHGLVMEASIRVREDMLLQGSDAENLLAMTLYMWKASSELQAQIGRQEPLAVSVDVVVSRYQNPQCR